MMIIVAVSPPPGIGSGILVMTDEVGLDVIVLDAVHGQKDLITIILFVRPVLTNLWSQ